MSRIDTKFIRGIAEAVASLFAPAITEGQTITCYAGEQITPYVIQGDNILSLSSIPTLEELLPAVASLFAPAITEGQTITCYVGEQIIPYVIQGDNILSLSSIPTLEERLRSLEEAVSQLSADDN